MRRLLAMFAVAALLAGPAVVPAVGQEATPIADATPAAATPVAEDLSGRAPTLDEETLAAFDAYAAERLAAMGVPGAAVAVVHGGEVVFARGYGVRALGSDQPVTPDTLMLIGSATKSMTATMAATLVDDGFATWDESVARLLPGFRLSDPALTDRITLADSFCACTGIPRHDAELIMNFNELSTDALIASMETFPVTAPFGAEFQYSNQMFAVGGYAAARAAGAPLDDLQEGYELAMEQRLLGPLGMERSGFDLGDVLATGDYALPHAGAIDGSAAPIRLLMDQAFVESVAPAGGLWSTASEMASYVAMQLADGVGPDGGVVVSPENLARTREAGIEVPNVLAVPSAVGAPFEAYGLGWGIGSWHGLQLINHSGATLGFAAEVGFLPEADLGVVVLSNGGPLAGIYVYDVQYRLFELAYGLEAENGAFLDTLLEGRPAALAAGRAALSRVDPAVVAPFAGAYANPALGEVLLRLDRGRLTLDAGELSTELLALNRGRAYAFADPPLAGGPGSITFQFAADGAPELVLDFPADDGSFLTYVFARDAGAADATNPADGAATPAATPAP
jgi:CubicO group peptidase (beta-lactamase class C family)